MADLLINPLLNTGTLRKGIDSTGAYVTIMRPDSSNTSTSVATGDWVWNNQYLYAFYDNRFAFLVLLGYRIFLNLYYHSNIYHEHLRQQFVVTDSSSFSNFLFSIDIKTRVRSADGAYYDIGITDGSDTYMYNSTSDTWVLTSTYQYNVLIDGFELDLNTTDTRYIKDRSVFTSIASPPINGDAYIIISNLIVDPTKYAADNTYLSESMAAGGWDSGAHPSMIIDYVSIIPSNEGDLPHISGFTNTQDDGTGSGSTTILGSGGTTPYTYSLDNIVYQSSNVFDYLTAGGYTAYLKDAYGRIATKDFIISSIITYGLRIETSLVSEENDTYSVELYEANYTGDSVERDLAVDGLNLSYNEQNDFFGDPLRGSSISMKIKVMEGDNFTSIVSGSNRNAYISVRKNGVKFWSGWVMPAFFLETFDAAPFDLLISARDGLGEFKENDFDNIDDYGIRTTGENTINSIFSRLLKSISIDAKIYVDNSINTYSGVLWWNTSINIDKYLIDNDKISDLLINILNDFKIKLRQVGGDWYFTRVISFVRSTLYWDIYDISGNYQGKKTSSHRLQIDGNQLNAPSIMLQEPYKKIVVNENYGKREAGNLNSDFSDWDFIGNNTWSLNDWDGINAGKIYSGEEPKAVTCVIDPSGTLPFLSQTIKNVEAGGSFKWSTAVKLLGDLDKTIPGGTVDKEYDAVEIAMRITVTNGTTVYYFDAEDGTWDTTEENILLINFSSESGSESGYKICDTIPVDGTIECRLYRNQYISYSCSEFKIEFLNNDGDSYNNIKPNYYTVNPQNRLTPDAFNMNFSDVPTGYNNRLMYTGYIWDGSAITDKWIDSIFGSIQPISGHYIDAIARLKAKPYRRLSGTFKSGDITPLKTIMVYEKEISSVTEGDTTTTVSLYRGYMFSGGSFSCYKSDWSGQWLERYTANITEVVVDDVPEDPVIEIIPRLLIDSSHYLLIDNTNKLLIN